MDTPKAEPRLVEGRYEGRSFTVEVRQGEGSHLGVHEVRVDGVLIEATPPRAGLGMNAALQAGAALARAHIDAAARRDAGQSPLLPLPE